MGLTVKINVMHNKYLLISNYFSRHNASALVGFLVWFINVFYCNFVMHNQQCML